MGCKIQQDGDRLQIGILLVRDKVRSGRYTVYCDGDVSQPMTVELKHAPGSHYETELRQLDVI